MEYKSELHLQQLIWLWFYSEYPEYRIKSNSKKVKQPRCLLIHNLTNSKSVVEGAKLASCGLTKGLPDLALLVPSSGYQGLYIELKLPGRKPEDYQTEVMEALQQVGYACEWTDDLEDAKKIIKEYLGK